MIPEVLSYPYPIGFDTIYYAARLQSGVVWQNWSSMFSTWLLYALVTPLHQVMQWDPFLLLKVVAPALYGLNVCGIYYFARNGLGWNARKSLMAAAFFAFQLAALRISWDLFRNTLGLGVLLFALPWIRRVETKRGFAVFVLLSTLVVFSHEYASVTMLAVVLGLVAWNLLKSKKVKALKLATAILPASMIFLASLYFIVFPLPSSAVTNVITVGDTFHSGKFAFFVNYIGVLDTVQHYPTYLSLASNVFALFSLLYLLSLPLILVGLFRDRMLDSWSLLLIVGSFGALVSPFFALDLWNRWMFMLVYPFTFYAVNGVTKVLEFHGAHPNFRLLKWLRVSKKMMLGMVSGVVILGAVFMTVLYGNSGVLYTPDTILYFPSGMLHSTVPLQDVKGTVETLEWLNTRMNDGSCVLIQHAILWWADMYLGKVHPVVYYSTDANAALKVALGRGFGSVFLVWWNQNIGWYGIDVPKGFMTMFSSGRISVFEYSPQ